MKKFVSEGGDLVLFVSRETIDEFADELADESDHLEEGLFIYTERCLKKYLSGLYKEYIEAFSESTDLRGIAVLFAHGESYGRNWLYWDWDKDFPKRVQGWIDGRDGKYACLICLTCNPGAVTPRSKSSLLVVADAEVSIFTMGGEYHWTLIHPQHGEIDDYIVENELATLQGRSPG